MTIAKVAKVVVVVLVVAAMGVGFWKLTAKRPLTSGVTNHTKGAGNKQVKMIEYGDFECPVCGRYYTVVEQVLQKYGDDITFEFRHLPISSLHQNAVAAHRAAESAGRQGKFWDMYNKLYTEQQSWGGNSGISTPTAVTVFEGYARDIGLDLARFKTDFISQSVNDSITADINEFENLKTPMATPTFVINDQVVKAEELAGDPAKFSALIDAAIALKNPSPVLPTPVVDPAPIQ